VRIVGGENRGRRLAAPRGRRTRPTAERVREALFDVLGPSVAGTRVLDLYAGTGAIGLEALSRGALRAVFVERDREALRALRQNLERLRLPRAAARIVAGDVPAALDAVARSEAAFDLVFLDPPYRSDLAARTLRALGGSRLLAAGARVVVQHPARTPLPAVAGLVPHRRARRFGETALTLLSAEGYTPDARGPTPDAGDPPRPR
jgi:16S rRNA (guanine966-N2)-methyltransferase